jgi:hypothetical protein
MKAASTTSCFEIHPLAEVSRRAVHLCIVSAFVAESEQVSGEEGAVEPEELEIEECRALGASWDGNEQLGATAILDMTR